MKNVYVFHGGSHVCWLHCRQFPRSSHLRPLCAAYPTHKEVGHIVLAEVARLKKLAPRTFSRVACLQWHLRFIYDAALHWHHHMEQSRSGRQQDAARDEPRCLTYCKWNADKLDYQITLTLGVYVYNCVRASAFRTKLLHHHGSGETSHIAALVSTCSFNCAFQAHNHPNLVIVICGNEKLSEPPESRNLRCVSEKETQNLLCSSSWGIFCTSCSENILLRVGRVFLKEEKNIIKIVFCHALEIVPLFASLISQLVLEFAF